MTESRYEIRFVGQTGTPFIFLDGVEIPGVRDLKLEAATEDAGIGHLTLEINLAASTCKKPWDDGEPTP